MLVNGFGLEVKIRKKNTNASNIRTARKQRE